MSIILLLLLALVFASMTQLRYHQLISHANFDTKTSIPNPTLRFTRFDGSLWGFTVRRELTCASSNGEAGALETSDDLSDDWSNDWSDDSLFKFPTFAAHARLLL